jgi:hypothetical protein
MHASNCTNARIAHTINTIFVFVMPTMNIHLELDSRAGTSGAAELTSTQVGHGVCGVWVSFAERLGQAIGRVAWSTSASWLRRIAVHVGVEPVHGRGNVIPHADDKDHSTVKCLSHLLHAALL